MARSWNSGLNNTYPSTYQYRPIDDDDIRLLTLYPAENGDPKSRLRGQLLPYHLTPGLSGSQDDSSDEESNTDNHTSAIPHMDSRYPEAVLYEALSYTWDGNTEPALDSDPYLHIFENVVSSASRPGLTGNSMHQRELGHFRLTQNLNQALRTFRAELKPDSRPLTLWIDAICIWQDGGHHEKAAQIRKMAHIYAEAINVRVWLGHGRQTSVDVHEFIKHLLTLETFDKTARAKENVDEWNALKDLMQSPWFQRRWVVQEIAFARQATVHWGNVVMSWNELASAVQLFASKIKTLRRTFHKAEETHHNPDYVGEIEAYGAKNLVDTLDKMLRRSQDGNIMELLLSLENILTMMTAFDVSYPHDTLYAVVQLSSDAIPAADRTINQEEALHNPRNGDPMNGTQVPVISEPLGQLRTRISDSPERFDSSCWRAQGELLDQLVDWPQRGRGITRGSSGLHLAVRNEDNLRPRSRSRARSRSPSPAVARSIAEKHHRKPRRKFLIDYDKSILKLCTEVVDFVTAQSKSLDIICKPWAPDMPNGQRNKAKNEEDRYPYPSWIQPLSKRTFNMEKSVGNRRSSRIGPDSLAGSQIPGYKTYSASGIIPPELPRGTPLIDGRILNTRGFVLDKVVKVSTPAHNATIPYSWLELEWTDKTNSGVESLAPEQFWRTLVANRESSNSPSGPPLYWRQACQWAFNQRSTSSNLDTAYLIQNLSGAVSKAAGDFLHRVRSVVWDRVLIQTKGAPGKSGLLGLAPKETQEGDLICILYGCSVPVVLRLKDREKQRRTRSASKLSSARQPKRRKTFHEASSHKSGQSEPGSGSPTALPLPSLSKATSADTNEARPTNATARELSSDANENEAPSPELESGEEYALIGECYIHGMMDGEAFALQQERSERQKKKAAKSKLASGDRYVAVKGDSDGLSPNEWDERTFRLGCCFDCTCPRCW